MFKQLSRLILPIVVTVGVAGCSNTPTATKADIPLVHSSLAYSLAPDKELAINIPKANIYHDTQESFSIRFNGHQYESLKHYISATGNKCIRFYLQACETASSDIQRKMTTCQRNGQWRVITPLVASATVQGE